MVIVDSSAWIEALRRNGNLSVKLAIEGLLEAYEAQTCSPVRLEVLGGARLAEKATLGRYFSVIPHRAIREDDWERSISLAWRLRECGLTVPWLDVMIASVALHDGMRLFTVDSHFTAIAQLTGLRLYRADYGGQFMPEE